MCVLTKQPQLLTEGVGPWTARLLWISGYSKRTMKIWTDIWWEKLSWTLIYYSFCNLRETPGARCWIAPERQLTVFLTRKHSDAMNIIWGVWIISLAVLVLKKQKKTNSGVEIARKRGYKSTGRKRNRRSSKPQLARHTPKKKEQTTISKDNQKKRLKEARNYMLD